MNYGMVDPRQIAPNPWNSNVVSEEMALKIQASIKRNGWFKPAIVRELADGSMQSIGGQHRIEQSIILGMSEVPVCNLGEISDEQAKEISLADNARYGHDDTLKLSELIESLDKHVLTATLPFDDEMVAAMSRSLAVNIDDLDLDSIDDAELPDDDEEVETKPERTIKTHQLLRFKNSISDAARLSTLITQTMKAQGFTKEDDLTNAGDALAFLLLKDVADV